MGETLRIVRIGFAACVAWVVVHEVTSLGGAIDVFPWTNKWVHLAPMLFAALTCAAGGTRRADERRAWWLIAGGIAAWTLGDVWYVARYWDDPAPPMPSAADLGYLLAPVGLCAGVILLWNARKLRGSTERHLDGVAAALAVAAISCALVVAPVADAAPGEPLSAAVHLAYPLLDAAVLGAAVAAMASAGWRLDLSAATLAAGILAFWSADSSYLVQAAAGTYLPGDPLDVGWYLGVLLMAAAPWMPAGAARAPRGPAIGTVMPLVFAAVNGAVVAGAIAGFGGPVSSLLALAGLVAVLARLGLTLVAHERLLVDTERAACTDALTGLPNRRALIRDLTATCAAASAEHPAALAYFDLDGFKRYNDTFGHAAGDDLLAQLGRALEADADRLGAAYRLGGDEFCLLLGADVVRGGGAQAMVERASAALTARAGAVTVTSSYGWIALPREANEPQAALALADARMYEKKRASQAA